MTTVLLSGFEAFDGDTRNPSGEIAKQLNGERIASRRVVGIVLPVEFGRAARQLLRSIEHERPDIVIATGIAASRGAITPERFALNFVDARIADNAGRTPRARSIVRSAPLALPSTLRISRMLDALGAAKLPAEASLSAGSYVCNEVFFRLQHALSGSEIRSGFVHLPHAREMASGNTSAWPLQVLLTAVREVLAVA
mgnify:FL=1